MADFKKLSTLFSLILLLFINPLIAEATDGYLSVTGSCNLEFPKDHGAHPGYRTEWWYYTGNVRSESGDRYGFQLTFFRRQISLPGAENAWPSPPSAWRTQQIYLAHAAISDIAAKRHLQAELVAREALAMTGVRQTETTTVVFLRNWSARIGPVTQVLKVDTDAFSYELTLRPVKPPVLHGLDGYSLKGSTPERASCYYSYTRNEVEGRITTGGKTFAVSGLGWMDHEFSTALLEPGIKGWDWFSLQLSDQTEIMVFLLRTQDGNISAVSGGTYVGRDGQTSHLSSDDVAVTVLDTWQSRHSKAVYPSRWRLQIFPHSLALTIVSNLANQEMQTFESTGVTYWEGSVSISGTIENHAVKGKGYVELTGYAADFEAPLF